ncbi:MAG: hypothetical protein JWQ55_5391, partial [Rhodopila sp.]|nr:hypothetical protein [Rhodopila sp.]
GKGASPCAAAGERPDSAGSMTNSTAAAISPLGVRRSCTSSRTSRAAACNAMDTPKPRRDIPGTTRDPPALTRSDWLTRLPTMPVPTCQNRTVDRGHADTAQAADKSIQAEAPPRQSHLELPSTEPKLARSYQPVGESGFDDSRNARSAGFQRDRPVAGPPIRPPPLIGSTPHENRLAATTQTKKRRCLWHRRSLGRKRPRKQCAEARLQALECPSQVQHASPNLLRRSIFFRSPESVAFQPQCLPRPPGIHPPGIHPRAALAFDVDMVHRAPIASDVVSFPLRLRK